MRAMDTKVQETEGFGEESSGKETFQMCIWEILIYCYGTC